MRRDEGAPRERGGKAAPLQRPGARQQALPPSLDRMTTASPADRYAATVGRRAEEGPELSSFRGLYDFAFDDFQVRACRALAGGHGVLVAAPTGSGKTVVGEFAVHLALAQGG